MKITNRKIGTMLSGLLCVAAYGVSSITLAQADFPKKAISLVVWSGAGGSLDVYGRKLSEMLTKEVGWQNKVENRAGGSGSAGLSYMMTQPADGHTWVILTGTLTFGIAQGLIPFKVDDLTFIRSMQGEPSSLAVPKDSTLKTVQDFLDALKKDPRSLRVGGHSSGGFHQYMLYQLMSGTGIKPNWIPHDASGKIPLSLLGNHLDVAMMTPSSGLSQVETGDIRLLAISTAERSQFYPDVPTFREQGHDLVDFLWRGVVVKAGTPQDVVDSIQAALDKIEASQEWQDFMKAQGQSNPNLRGDAFRDDVIRQIAEQVKFLNAEGFIKKGS